MNAWRLLFFILALAVCGVRTQASEPKRVRTGDTIEVELGGVPVEESAAFDRAYTVNEKGVISLPFIGWVKVAGLFPGQIEEVIENRLIGKKIYTHPKVAVQLIPHPGFVTIINEREDGRKVRIPVSPNMTLMTAITAAGGFTDFADRHLVALIRRGKKTLYNTRDIVDGKAEDPKLLAGDTIILKQSGIFGNG